MSLIDLSLSGLSKPGTKLIEKVSDAIGVLYEPRRIKKKAEAEAEAAKISYLAELELKDIELRGLERVIKQEARKQENIENITLQAARQMDEDDAVSDLDQDWIVHFFNECEDISDKELQTVWARILSEQTKQKNTFSKRTINFLSSLDKQDAELITIFGQFVWQASIPSPIIFDIKDQEIRNTGMEFIDLLHLESIGFITIGMGYTLHFGSEKGRIQYFDKIVELDFSSLGPHEEKKIDTGTIVLTTVGQELVKICGAKKNISYFNYCIERFKAKDNVKARIVSTDFKMKY